jgi:DNA mismatch repair protein MutS
MPIFDRLLRRLERFIVDRGNAGMDDLKETRLTPLMQQYCEIKQQQHPDTIVLFQVGDFYELFFEDAKTVSAFLGITLTKRGQFNGEPIPLCGVPVHALNHYLHKLVRGGFKVAICDQLDPAVPGKMVRRGVTQILTPGMLTDTQLLDEKAASYLFSFFPLQDQWGLLFGEVLTAQLFATVLPGNAEKQLESEVVRFFPDEILLPNNQEALSFQRFFKQWGYFTSLEKTDPHDREQATTVHSWMHNQFTSSMCTQVENHEALRCALHNFYFYVRKNQQSALDQFHALHFYEPDDFLMLDAATQKNLELVKNSQDGSRATTLFSVMDRAVTSMGSRMVRKWIMRPLVNRTAVEQRLDVVDLLTQQVSMNQQVHEILADVGDVERIIGRIALRRGTIHDYSGLKRSLAVLPRLHHVLADGQHREIIKFIGSQLLQFSQVHDLLDSACNDDSTIEWIIKPGFDAHLDHLRLLVGGGNKKILELERAEQAATGINSLKIRYNNVQGYYIEVTKANAAAVPDRYIRQQTLVGRERYTTHELRALQDELATAQSEITRVEGEVFERVQHAVAQHIAALRRLAHALAHLDALHSFACVAYDNDYVRPTFNDERNIVITQGRHPVVEQSLTSHFIPNDTVLTDEQSLWIITGPNMGGKSTYLRQVALICVMAQCGSFVPVHSANIPLLDRIFTRIGSGDNLAGGKSTFLVEMEETALICANATKNSLVILDEVGRGTSTFDGLAIAQAVVEHLFVVVQARCLFATHYHELTALQDRYPGMVSFYTASKKTSQGIVFLHTMVRGVAGGSFGLEVAKLAQLPAGVIERAESILQGLMHGKDTVTVQPAVQQQSGLRELEAELACLRQEVAAGRRLTAMLESVDYNDLSPKKAFDLVWKLKEG